MTTLAAAIIFAAAIWNNSAGPVSAFNPQPDPPAFGMIGITNTQTARLNVVRVQPTPAGDRPVRVELSFFDSQGMLLLRSTESLMPGHAAFLDLDGATLMMPRAAADSFASDRAQIRGTVHIIQSIPVGESNTLNLVPTLEVFDNAGIDAGKTRMGWSGPGH